MFANPTLFSPRQRRAVFHAGCKGAQWQIQSVDGLPKAHHGSAEPYPGSTAALGTHLEDSFRIQSRANGSSTVELGCCQAQGFQGACYWLRKESKHKVRALPPARTAELSNRGREGTKLWIREWRRTPSPFRVHFLMIQRARAVEPEGHDEGEPRGSAQGASKTRRRGAYGLQEVGTLPSQSCARSQCTLARAATIGAPRQQRVKGIVVGANHTSPGGRKLSRAVYRRSGYVEGQLWRQCLGQSCHQGCRPP